MSSDGFSLLFLLNSLIIVLVKKRETKHAVYKLAHICILTPTHKRTFPVELQGAQQADRFEHLSDVHLQTALQLDEEPTDLRVDLPVLRPEMAHYGNTARLLDS